MIKDSPAFRFPARLAACCIGGVAFILLVLANVSSAVAASVGAMPGALETLGEPLKAITSAPSADLLEVRKGKKAKKKRKARSRKAKKRRKARNRRYAKRRKYNRRYSKRRYYRGPSIYLSIPLAVGPRYGYRPYYAPYYGRCTRWRNRCAANWGYRTRSYYGCLRYHGC